MFKRITQNPIIQYGWNVFIAVDQLANTILFGDPDETISSRMGKWMQLPHNTWRFKIAYIGCRILHVLDKGHCDKSIESDEGKDALVK